jgi:hypothetical protein
MTEDSLSSRIRSEAAIADRPGQYARLMQIAHELDDTNRSQEES